MPPAVPDPARLRRIVDRLEEGLLERGAPVRLCLLAALSGEHVLLIGPPGTAKSELARRLHRAFAGAPYFERLLTRFSTPEELFGPLSLKALEDDRYERLTAGYLPTAGIAFLDEVFKANSAILNALLTLLNEREFDNGTGRSRTPLVCVVAATNEVPSEESLRAFHDRFLLRVAVEPVSDASFSALLTLPAGASATGVDPVEPAELASMQAARDAVHLPAELLQRLHELRAVAAAHDIVVSDRRWRQLVGLLRTEALTDGRAEADAWDLWLAPYALAAEPAQMAPLQQWFVDRVAEASPQQAPWLERAVEAFERQLEIEQSAESEPDDVGAGKLALARAIGGGAGADEGGMLRIVSAALEERLRKRYSPAHRDARLAQVDEMLARAQAHLAPLQAQAEATRRIAAERLWLPPDLSGALYAAQVQRLATLGALLERLQAVRDGFGALPIDERLPATPPQPVAVTA